MFRDAHQIVRTTLMCVCVCTCFNFLGNFWRQWPIYCYTCNIKQGNWGRERESKNEKSKNNKMTKRISLLCWTGCTGKCEINRSVKVWDVVTGCMLCVCVVFRMKKNRTFRHFFYDVHGIIIVIIIMTIITDWVRFKKNCFHALKVWISLDVATFTFRFEVTNNMVQFSLKGNGWIFGLVLTLIIVMRNEYYWPHN